MARQRRGFTLIELLVVIAIIGILAAMLFPVFARARESARKTQCLANVKNIAMGVQIYLTDYDAFPPSEHRADAQQKFIDWISEDRGCTSTAGYRASWANPYIRWPVVLDEYIKSREVWKCPSAKYDFSSWWIIPEYNGGWLNYLEATRGQWQARGGTPGGNPCGGHGMPPGWGGFITDSIAQQLGNAEPSNGGPGFFSETIGYPLNLRDVKVSALSDVTNTLACADATNLLFEFQNPEGITLELCSLGCGADHSACPQSTPCSIDSSEIDAFS